MKIKDQYYNALKQNKGFINEIDLGKNIGLNENETMEIISQLLSEYKIEYVEHKNCAYRNIKKR